MHRVPMYLKPVEKLTKSILATLPYWQGRYFKLNPCQSPAYANLQRVLLERGWASSRFVSRTTVHEAMFDFDGTVSKTLECKHLLNAFLRDQHMDLMPPAWTIDWQSWPLVLQQLAVQAHSGPWILKPSLLNNGQGIAICEDEAAVERFFTSQQCLQGPYVLQQYLESPHLLQGPEHGHKYSLRFLMLMSNFSGTALYRHGYANIALKPYVKSHYQDLACHLTNEHLSGERFNVIQRPVAQFPMLDALFPRVERACRSLDACVRNRFPEAFNLEGGEKLAFLGVDFMLDARERLWLLEVNHGPCFPTSADHPLFQLVYEPFWQAVVSRFFELELQDEQDCSSLIIL